MATPEVKLFNILVRMLTETSRRTGDADILREQLDDSTGTTAESATLQHNAAFWETHRAKIERADKAAATKPNDAGSGECLTC